MPMRRAVGANYYSQDPADTGGIPTGDVQRRLTIDELTTAWGQIWAVLRPLEKVSR